MVKSVNKLGLLLFLFFAVPFAVWVISVGNTGDTIHINEYNADITINDAGDMRIIETWDMTYDEALRVRFRDIDFIKYPDNYPLYEDSNNKAYFDTESVSVQVFKDGIDVTDSVEIGYSFRGDHDERYTLVTCEPYRSNCESIFVDLLGAGGLEGDVTFVYDFTIRGVVTEYSNVSEINWVLFEYAEGNVETGEVNITLPDNSNEIGNYHIFSHGITGTISEVQSNTSINITFENMDKEDVLGFRVLAPTNIFTSILYANIVDSEEINLQIILDYEAKVQKHIENGETIESLYIYFLISLVVSMIVIAALLQKKYFTKHKVDFMEDIYRQLPSKHSPAIVGYMYRYQKTKDEDFTATILDLVRRGYMTLDDSLSYDSPDDFPVIIRREKTNDKELLTHESHLITLLINKIGNGTSVTTKQIEEYGNNVTEARSFQARITKFRKLIAKEAKKNDFFDKSLPRHKKTAMLFTIIPAVFFIVTIVLEVLYNINLSITLIVSFVLAVLYLIYVGSRKRRSEEGELLYLKWKAYNKYLEESEELKTYTMSSVDFWEHTLVFATMFGYADTVMEQLSIELPMTEEIAGQSRYLGIGYRHSSYRYGYSVHSLSNSYRRASRNAIRSMPSSSGSGRSGGGGGSFGGGGGGGRSR